MFTGIVSGLGRVAENRDGRLRIEVPGGLLKGAAPGASIAVNGCCLTAVGLDPYGFTAETVPETLRRTNLGRLRAGDPVNLERSVTPEQRLDGHIVQGHVDATVELVAVRPAALGDELEVELPAVLAHLVAEKGSVTLDGVSLTVAAVDDRRRTFTVALIPHTKQVTIAGAYVAGSILNLEVDVLARYVARLLERGRSEAREAG